MGKRFEERIAAQRAAAGAPFDYYRAIREADTRETADHAKYVAAHRGEPLYGLGSGTLRVGMSPDEVDHILGPGTADPINQGDFRYPHVGYPNSEIYAAFFGGKLAKVFVGRKGADSFSYTMDLDGLTLGSRSK